MSKLGKLKLGKLVPIKKERNTWWEKAWSYQVNGIEFGIIYKQIYPGGEVHPTIYRFNLMIKVLPSMWKEVPKHSKGIVSDHYSTKTQARKAMKKALITQIKFLNSCLIYPTHP